MFVAEIDGTILPDHTTAGCKTLQQVVSRISRFGIIGEIFTVLSPNGNASWWQIQPHQTATRVAA